MRFLRTRVPGKRKELPIIHVGFGHSGTTSLQENIFAKRADVFYAGVPYRELGGIFSSIKYLDPEAFGRSATERLCRELIVKKIKPGQRLVLSDETFVDQPAIYYTPPMMPVRTIAERLRAQFGPAVILFTLRNQFRYVISTYRVLKRNYCRLAGRTIEPFDVWFAGNQTQMRNLFLRNLDPSHAIRAYQAVFGARAVRVLPLEIVLKEGTFEYLRRVNEITGLTISQAEVEGYVARNVSPPDDIVLNEEQRAIIHRRAMEGNAFVATEFGLPLASYGYPMPQS